MLPVRQGPRSRYRKRGCPFVGHAEPGQCNVPDRFPALGKPAGHGPHDPIPEIRVFRETGLDCTGRHEIALQLSLCQRIGTAALSFTKQEKVAKRTSLGPNG